MLSSYRTTAGCAATTLASPGSSRRHRLVHGDRRGRAESQPDDKRAGALQRQRYSADTALMGSVRRAALAIAVVTICGAIAACGGSSAPSAAVRSADTVTAITKAQASAYAQAVNLQAGDLPNMTVAARESEKPDAKRVGKIERCAGDLLAKKLVASIRSATFSGATEAEHETIKSVVEVMPSVALAEQNHAYTRSQRALACAERFSLHR
jgi:hypothetical protein